jgi:c(7)-type cytochrome triheme protein
MTARGRRIVTLVGLLLVLTILPAGDLDAEYADVLLNRYAEAAGVRPVVYSHWFHRVRFRCKVCHFELGFEMRAGANDIRMKDLADGKFCGMCHNGEIAWGLENCDLCHTGLPGLPTGIYGGDKTMGPGRW